MSYPEGEDSAGRHHHHHHGRGHEKPDIDVDEEEEDDESLYRRSRTRYYYKKHYSKFVWFGVCFCLFIVVIILVWFGVLATTQNDNNQHIHQLDQRLSAATHKDTSNGMYSLASSEALKRDYTLALCHQALYRATTAPASATERASRQEILLPLDRAAQVRALVYKQPVEKSYAVEAELRLRYNVEADDVGYNVVRLGLKRGQKYLVLSYIVRSTYAQFSTIKLHESTMDVVKKTLRAKRAPITLCSNAADAASALRCARYTTRDENMMIDDVIILPATEVVRGGGGGAGPGGSTTTTVPAPPRSAAQDEREAEEEAARGIHIPANNAGAAQRQAEEELANTSLYHLLFYREKPESATGEEYIALVVEPTLC